ncbi:flavin monoamine oxidase family protein [Sphaerospermopsis aphanizomenoides BCCUSP55]|uniref:flavin monoamine oxidase family protein n=1 Tax=Sphaerospermopsis aphanizomenoides TaxID=459663 RepID=UPI001904D2C9|nr:flavin monoamine oxidase family protein [Sphaerospermopsis aphanizomenoides]MBK1986561.1 flavin monoamine oxidase family protein [Sphaerospermopsis aphanizomenoides BCCUSP55]
MLKFNRRQFLWRSALMLATTTSYHQVIAATAKTPGALEPTKSPQNVIIIGAGISGLVAAYELVAAGHQVRILEARQRTGGRVLTLRNKFSYGDFFDVGACRIPSTHNLTFAYTQHFGLNLKPFYPNKGLYVSLNKGKRTLSSLDELEKQRENLARATTQVDRVQRSVGKIQEWKKIDQGLDLLPTAFAKSLTGKIYLGDAVIRVEQNSLGVRVFCQSGKVYYGDCVVCTVPLTVLEKISFDPALSSEKQTAMIGGYNYRAATRMFVEYPERFWEKDNLNGWAMISDHPEELWQPTWDINSKRGILHGYLKDKSALEMDALKPDERLRKLLQRWAEILPGANQYPVREFNYSWHNDPWVKAGWAYPTIDQEDKLFQEIGRREGKIYFAGEHTSVIRGWIQGALESGIKTAQQIHNSVHLSR